MEECELTVNVQWTFMSKGFRKNALIFPHKLRISQSIFQSGVISLYSLPNLWSWYVTVEPITTPVILPLTQIAMTGSVYSVVAVAVERYFNICKPFRANWVR